MQFSKYLFEARGFYDNYVGLVFKCLKTFFNFLKDEKAIVTGEFFKRFYVLKEDIPVISLLPEQLHFLVTNKDFHNSLSRTLQKSKMIFIFGCTVALRRGDLFALKFTDIESRVEQFYLRIKTQKTGKLVRIRLPRYAMEIINWFASHAKKRETIFPCIPPSRFNHHIKEIAAQAGWTHIFIKCRNKRGVENTIPQIAANREYRFCDHLSSHTMRRTAITSMLMLGMNEYVVKLISGHCANSKSFSRYVNLAQSYLDTEMVKLEGLAI